MKRVSAAEAECTTTDENDGYELLNVVNIIGRDCGVIHLHRGASGNMEKFESILSKTCIMYTEVLCIPFRP